MMNDKRSLWDRWYKLNPDKSISPVSPDGSDMTRGEEKRVAKTTVGKKVVSTVFLGLDHNWTPGNEPLVFETMVFPEEGDYGEELCERYHTYQEARSGHAKIVKELRKELDKKCLNGKNVKFR